MSKATVVYQGGQSIYNFPFDYLAKVFVKVDYIKMDGTVQTLNYPTDYTVVDKSIVCTTISVATDRVKIYRQTTTDRIVTFVDSSILRAKDLNALDIQLLHINEESMDRVEDAGLVKDVADGKWNAKQSVIKNVADGTSQYDVVNRGQLDTIAGSTSVALASAAAARQSEVNASNAVASTNTALAESTGYGIVSGCIPSISGLTVTVASGIVHVPDGTRKELSASTVTLDAADNTNPRIDLVYINSTCTVAKITGTAAASPRVPALPSNGISVSQVSVAAKASAGTIMDIRGMLPRWYNSGIVNVKDFGAVGDGVTDDTVAIQVAINSGQNIVFENKTYICKGLNLKSNIVLIGNNAKLVSPSNHIPISDSAIFKMTNVVNVFIAGFTFAHANTTFTENGRLIEIVKSSYVCIDSCHFDGWTGDAVIIDDFDSKNDTTHHIFIRNNDFENNNTGRQAITIFTASNVYIERNKFVNTTYDGMPGAIDIEPWDLDYTDFELHDIYIRDNTCKNEYGMFLNICWTLATNIRNVYITNNIVNNDRDGIAIYHHVNKTGGYSDSVYITNNNINAPRFCLSLSTLSDVTLTKNYLTGGIVNLGGGYVGKDTPSLINLNVTNNTFIANSVYNSENLIFWVGYKEDSNYIFNSNLFITKNTVNRVFRSAISGVTLTKKMKFYNNVFVDNYGHSNGCMISGITGIDAKNNTVSSPFVVIEENHGAGGTTTNISESLTFNTASNTYELVKTLSIPPNKGYAISVITDFNSTQPTGIRICSTNDTDRPMALNEVASSKMGVSLNGYEPSGITLYVYIRWNSAGSNNVWIKGFYVNP